MDFEVLYERDRRLKLLRDLVAHGVFIAVFLTIIFLQRDVTSCNALNAALRSSLIDSDMQNFLEIQTWVKATEFEII
jgi:hypothetical protein